MWWRSRATSVPEFWKPIFAAAGSSDSLRDVQSRMQYLQRLQKEDDANVFGKACVDVLGNKVQGRVEMGQHVLLEDLQVFDTFSWQALFQSRVLERVAGPHLGALAVLATLARTTLTKRLEVPGQLSV